MLIFFMKQDPFNTDFSIAYMITEYICEVKTL